MILNASTPNTQHQTPNRLLFSLALLLFPLTLSFADDNSSLSGPAVPASIAEVTNTTDPSTAANIQPSATAAPVDNYAIGIEDIMDINVLQPEKMMITVQVAPDGSINVPYIGKVYAKGFALSDVQSEIQNRLAAGYMKYPVVSVTLRESRSRKFSVYGQVQRPGSYPVAEDNLSVLGAISQAGGFTVPGSTGMVKIIRTAADGTSQKIEVPINSSLESAKNTVVKPGDTLMVYEDKFFVYGEVQRPGPFSLEENLTVLRAVSMAGGFTRPGSSGRIKIIRPAADSGKFEMIEDVIGSNAGKKGEQIVVKSGDTIMVYEDKFFVYGEVQRPGQFPMEDNTTVLKAVSMAGGFTKFGSSSRVKCLRPYGDKPGYSTIKLNLGQIMDGNNQEDLVLQSGDIIVVSEGLF